MLLYILNAKRGNDHIKQGMYTLGICFFQKLNRSVVVYKDFFARKNPDIARKVGTATLRVSLVKTSNVLHSEPSNEYVGPVWIATTIQIARPLKKSK